MESAGVKQAVPLVVVVVVVVAVVAAGPGAVTANSRNNERIYTTLHELTDVLREGFNTLAGELRQERASREDFSRFLKAEVLGIRRAVQGLCRGVRVLSGGSDDACLDEGGGGGGGDGVHGAVHGPGRGAGETELVSLGSNSRPHVSVHDKTHSRDQPALTAPPSPDPISCPPPYRRIGNYCLTLLRERVNWEEARARCHSFGQSRGSVGEGDLAVVDDMDTFKAFIADTDFRDAPSGMALVGGSADGWGGAWVWVDGSLIKQLPWLYSQTGHQGTVLAVDRDNIFHTIIRRTALWPLCQLK